MKKILPQKNSWWYVHQFFCGQIFFIFDLSETDLKRCAMLRRITLANLSLIWLTLQKLSRFFSFFYFNCRDFDKNVISFAGLVRSGSKLSGLLFGTLRIFLNRSRMNPRWKKFDHKKIPDGMSINFFAVKLFSSLIYLRLI